MKNVIKKIYLVLKNAVFIVLFFAILLNVMAFWAPLFRYEEDQLATGTVTTYYAQDENTVDVVFIGASSIYRYMAPTVMYDKYGITSLNFSTAGMPVECMSGLIDEVINTQSPELIVLEVRDFVKWSERYDKGISSNTKKWLLQNESYINRLVNNMPISRARAKIIHDSVNPLLGQKEWQWQFEYYKTHNNWKDLKVSDVTGYIKDKLDGKNEINTSDGEYKYTDYKGTASLTQVYVADKPADFSNYNNTKEITGEWFGVMEELVAHAKECGTKVLFISTPYPATYNRVAYENFLGEHIESQGLDYLNCNKLYDEIGIDFASNFYDKKHTNLKGSIKVTEYVGNYIKETYGLKETKLTKAQKADWDTAVEKWNKEVRYPGLVTIQQKVAKINGAS